MMITFFIFEQMFCRFECAMVFHWKKINLFTLVSVFMTLSAILVFADAYRVNDRSLYGWDANSYVNNK